MSFLLYPVVAFAGLFLFKKWINSPYTPYKRDMTGQIVIVTGSSAGIGKEAAKSLLKYGATVVFANRDETKTNRVIDNIIIDLGDETIKSRAHFIQIDMASFDSVVTFCNNFNKKFDKLDVLVNNAGAAFTNYAKTRDGIESTWQVNHLSPTLLTGLLLDKISNSKDARIINVSSKGHRGAPLTSDYFEFKQENYKIFKAYSATKAGNIFLTQALQQYSEKHKINLKSAAVHPGLVASDIWSPNNQADWWRWVYYFIVIPAKKLVMKTEESGAQTILHLVYMPKEEFVNGAYYDSCKVTKTSSLITDKEYKQRSNICAYNMITNSDVYKRLDNTDKLELFELLKE